MKKNKMLRTASAMLILTIITISIIGGALAKYTTEATGSDTAVVAKFGVTATVSGDLFGKIYKTGENTILPDNAADEMSVKATEKVLAPGTHNKTGMTLSVKGNPEVSTKLTLGDVKNEEGTVTYVNSDIYLTKGIYGVMVKYTAGTSPEDITKFYTKDSTGTYSPATVGTTGQLYELRQIANLTDMAFEYRPLQWNVGGAGEGNCAFQNIVKNIKDKFFMTGNELSKGLNDGGYDLTTTVGWEWPFEQGNNAADTILGYMIAAHAAKEDREAAIDVVVIGTDDGLSTVTYEKSSDELVAAGKPVIYACVDAEKVACLTAAFNVSLKVEQVD